MNESIALKRSLRVWQIVMLGMGWVVPMIVFDTFGIASELSGGLVPLAYIIALGAMLFTAFSYGKMVRAFPSAGSSYTYTQKTMSPYLAFLVGWASLLDYLLIPMISALLIQIYCTTIFPDIPTWIWIVGYVIVATAINMWSVNLTANVNSVLLFFQIVVIVCFVFLAIRDLHNGMGVGTPLTIRPFYQLDFHFSGVIAAATVLCFSFLGFDAVTNYTEEALHPTKDIPKAILITALTGGLIFIVGSYFTQALFPNPSSFHDPGATAPEISLYAGGKLFQMFFLSASFAGSFASGLASHASVSRLLFVMGRDHALPKKLFGYLHPQWRTPVFNVLLVGGVCLTAMFFNLEMAAALVNFGALIAFTFVNLSVIAYYAIRLKRYKTPSDFFKHVIMPSIGAAFVAVLWFHLELKSFILGVCWVVAGFIYLVCKTKIVKSQPGTIEIREDIEEQNVSETVS
ncbi:APC family permease [Brevibacillus reuszeri]|uniref:APC family permease n=1 Tax=Brevibacillus reuszeri TaxID=54915 RepID=UPI003D2232D9